MRGRTSPASTVDFWAWARHERGVSAQIIDGKALAQKVRAEIKERAEGIEQRLVRNEL